MTGQSAIQSVARDLITGVSICLVIFSATLYLPLMGFFLAMVLPMPITYYRLKIGRNLGAAMMAIILAVIAGTTSGAPLDLLFFGSLLFTGFFLGESIEMHVSIERTALFTCAASMGTCFLLFFLYTLTTGQNMIQLISGYVSANLEMTLGLYSEMGIPQESIDLVARSMDTIQYVMVRIIPALFFVMTMMVVWVNTLFIKKILINKGLHLPQLDNLNQWRAPEKLVWPVIFFILLLLVPIPTNVLKILGLNCILAVMPIYFFQGIAVVSFVLEKRSFPRLLRFFIYSIIAIQQIFLFVVVGLGFFDTWIDFRKLGTMGEGKEQE
ncbi:MAG: YybS family protein [Desulfobacterium sp.]|nr:YybS family protein [Desulfobacterium sp.]